MPIRRKIDDVIFSQDRAKPDTVWEVYAQLLSDIFGEITEQNEMLEKCYCPIRTRKFDEYWLPSITTGIPTALLCDPDQDPDYFLSDHLMFAEVENPFLIIGNVGTGKSTYIHYFFKVGLKKLHLDSKIEGIIINLGKIERDADSKDLKLFIDNKINEHIVENYQEFYEPDYELILRVFEDELRPFKKIYAALARRVGREKAKSVKIKDVIELQKNIRSYNIGRIRYIKNKYEKKLFIVLDNIDHHHKDFQESTFLLSQSLMTDFQCPIILTVREYTFTAAYRHTKFSAFQPRFLHLSSPIITEVIKKRTDYALKEKHIDSIFVGKDKVILNLPNEEPFELSRSELKERLSIILNSFLSEEILYTLERLSNTDMRTLMKIVRVALSSGYLYPPQRQLRYNTVRHYDFLKAIMLGNNPYYRPKDPSTMIINLFENEEKQYEGNNLIRYRTLQCIDYLGDDTHIDDVYDFMVLIGYQFDKIKKILKLFLRHSLIEPTYPKSFNIDRIEFFKITLTGKYYLDNLINNIDYYQNIKHATYMDRKYFDKVEADEILLKKLSKNEYIKFDINSTDSFIKFIENKEKNEKRKVEELSIETGNSSLIDKYKKLESISSIKPFIERRKEKILSYVKWNK